MKKKILSDAIIAWMRYKRNVIKIPAYCTSVIEWHIRRWSPEKLAKVVRYIRLDDGLLRCDSCPFCIAYVIAFYPNGGMFGWLHCRKCEFGKINGVCGDDNGLWYKNNLDMVKTTPANRRRFNAIFKKLQEE